MNTVNANDEVEILNNGNRLGSAPVVNGRWDYPTPHLPVGTHNLTATFRGKQSAAWRLTVEKEQPVTDNFLGIPYGDISTVTRDHFNLTVKEANGPGGFAQLQSWQLRPQDNLPNYSSPVLLLNVSQPAGSNNRSRLTVEFFFPRPYSYISLSCRVWHQSTFSTTSTAKVTRSNGETIQQVDFLTWPHKKEDTVTLGKSTAADVWFLVLTLEVFGQTHENYEEVLIDSLTMIP